LGSLLDYGPVVPFPNTDPGLAGETGTSGVTGAVASKDLTPAAASKGLD
jgi:hypothetical protein